MEDTAMEVVADVQFRSTADGGRQGPTPPDKFHCMFEVDGKLFDCRLMLGDVGSISPGGRARVPIRFLYPELVRSALSIGKEFHLREIGRIADGVVHAINELAPRSRESV